MRPLANHQATFVLHDMTGRHATIFGTCALLLVLAVAGTSIRVSGATSDPSAVPQPQSPTSARVPIVAPVSFRDHTDTATEGDGKDDVAVSNEAIIVQMASYLGGHVLRCRAIGMTDQRLIATLSTPASVDFPNNIVGEIRDETTALPVPDEPGAASWEGSRHGRGIVEWDIREGRATCIVFRQGEASDPPRHPSPTSQRQNDIDLCRYWRGQVAGLHAALQTLPPDDRYREALQRDIDAQAARIEDDFCRGIP